MFIKLAKFILLRCAVVAYAFFYPCFVLLVSTLSTTVVQVPGQFFYPKYVADLFAQYIWLCATAVLLVFVLSAQYTLTAGRLFKILPAGLRLLSNLALTFVGVFVLIDFLSVANGECSSSAYTSHSECLENKYSWSARPLPVSCFLTFYAMLVLLEETKVYEEWEELEGAIRRKYELDMMYGTSFRACDSVENFADVEKVIALYGESTTTVKTTFCILAVIMVLLHVANLIVILYTPTLSSVVLASLVAVFLWAVTYRLVYRVQFCTFKKSVHRTKIEEYIAVAECTSEKNNVIEEILASNEIRRHTTGRSWLLSRMYKSYSYDSL